MVGNLTAALAIPVRIGDQSDPEMSQSVFTLEPFDGPGESGQLAFGDDCGSVFDRLARLRLEIGSRCGALIGVAVGLTASTAKCSPTVKPSSRSRVSPYLSLKGSTRESDEKGN